MRGDEVRLYDETPPYGVVWRGVVPSRGVVLYDVVPSRGVVWCGVLLSCPVLSHGWSVVRCSIVS